MINSKQVACLGPGAPGPCGTSLIGRPPAIILARFSPPNEADGIPARQAEQNNCRHEEPHGSKNANAANRLKAFYAQDKQDEFDHSASQQANDKAPSNFIASLASHFLSHRLSYLDLGRLRNHAVAAAWALEIGVTEYAAAFGTEIHGHRFGLCLVNPLGAWGLKGLVSVNKVQSTTSAIYGDRVASAGQIWHNNFIN
jgi:hypothetical protein